MNSHGATSLLVRASETEYREITAGASQNPDGTERPIEVHEIDEEFADRVAGVMHQDRLKRSRPVQAECRRVRALPADRRGMQQAG